MENQGFSTADAVLTSAMSGGFGGGGRGGGGGLWGGGVSIGSEAIAAHGFADGTAVKEAIDCNADRFNDGLNRVSDQAEESRRSAQFTSLEKSITDSEFRGLDRQRDLERILNQNSKDDMVAHCGIEKSIAESAKETAKCCCDAQLLAVSNQAAVIAEIKAQAFSTQARDLDRANAELTQLKTIAALRDNGHRG